MRLFLLLGCYNHFRFQMVYGRISLWILLLGFQNLRDLIVCLWWLIDSLSIFIFFSLRHPFTAKSVTNIFLKEVVKFHGVSIFIIIGDWGPIFLSHFWIENFRLMCTQLKMSSPYHPRRTGRLKRLTSVWNNICIALLRNNQKLGFSGCIR